MNEYAAQADLDALGERVEALEAEGSAKGGALQRMQNQLVEYHNRHEESFRQQDERFDRLEGRFDKLEGRFDRLEGRFDKLEGRFDKLEIKVDTRFQQMTLEIQELKDLIRNAIKG